MTIRKARMDDVSRIAEIYVFNNRVNYFPIFKDEEFSFRELQVSSLMEYLKRNHVLDTLYVYEDNIIRGFMQLEQKEICKLYVDTSFQNQGIGAKLMTYAIQELQVDRVWALEKNQKAVAFYERHGFVLSGDKKLEEGTSENLVKLIYRAA